MEKRIIKASEQSERLSVPILRASIALEEYLKAFAFVAWADECAPEENTIIDVFQGSDKHANLKESISLLIGPEGGFSDREREILSNSTPSVRPFSLGREVLRTETAVAAGLSALKQTITYTSRISKSDIAKTFIIRLLSTLFLRANYLRFASRLYML